MMNGFDETAQQEVNELIESSFSGIRAEERQALAGQDHARSVERTHRWATILRLLLVAFLFTMGSVAVAVYLLASAANGNGDTLFAVGVGVAGALWLGLATVLRKDFIWLAEAFRGFQN